MENKETYETLELNVFFFENVDIITDSLIPVDDPYSQGNN